MGLAGVVRKHVITQSGIICVFGDAEGSSNNCCCVRHHLLF